MQNGDKLTAGQIRALEKQLQNGMQNVVKLVGNEVKQTGKAKFRKQQVFTTLEAAKAYLNGKANIS